VFSTTFCFLFWHMVGLGGIKEGFEDVMEGEASFEGFSLVSAGGRVQLAGKFGGCLTVADLR